VKKGAAVFSETAILLCRKLYIHHDGDLYLIWNTNRSLCRRKCCSENYCLYLCTN